MVVKIDIIVGMYVDFDVKIFNCFKWRKKNHFAVRCSKGLVNEVQIN